MRRSSLLRSAALNADGDFPLAALASDFHGHPLLVGCSVLLRTGFDRSVWEWRETDFWNLHGFLDRNDLRLRSCGWHRDGYAINLWDRATVRTFLARYSGETHRGPR